MLKLSVFYTTALRKFLYSFSPQIINNKDLLALCTQRDKPYNYSKMTLEMDWSRSMESPQWPSRVHGKRERKRERVKTNCWSGVWKLRWAARKERRPARRHKTPSESWSKRQGWMDWWIFLDFFVLWDRLYSWHVLRNIEVLKINVSEWKHSR